MTTIEITKFEGLRAGDVVTLILGNGVQVTGTVKDSKFGLQFTYAGGVVESCIHTAYASRHNFVSATREIPALPTEPGSVIVNATIRGVEGQTAFLAQHGQWVTGGVVGRDSRTTDWIHGPAEVTAWTPAKVVADGEPVTR